jgi:FMN reductase
VAVDVGDEVGGDGHPLIVGLGGTLSEASSSERALRQALAAAQDYIEDLRGDVRPYLDGRTVGCIVCAYGWQATTTTTLVSLRSTVHALRGWPTPLGVATNSLQPISDANGLVVDDQCAQRLSVLSAQVLDFVGARR